MKHGKKLFCICLIAVMSLTFATLGRSLSINVGATSAQNANRMNVVFVIDQSGSIYKTDNNAFRFEAIDLFLGLATDKGNYMGAVVFDDNIILQKDITEMSGKEAKTALSQSLKSLPKTMGDTDIGKAIETATEMLRTSGNHNLDSAIILLSDGNTDLPKDKTGKALEASNKSKENAIQNARNNGYKIHSICLNSDDFKAKADPEELRKISEATDGIFVEVRNANGLKAVFNEFYNLIYSTNTITLADTTIPDNGILEIPFSIPMIGVEEANIIINTLNAKTSYTLWKPGNIEMSEGELDSYRIKANTFSIIKIPDPEAGEWRIIVKGIPGDQVKIDMVYNSNLVLGAEVNHGNETCKLGEDIQIQAQIYNNEVPVTDPKVYENYPIYAYIEETSTGKREILQLTPAGTQAEGGFAPNDYQDYDIRVGITVDNINVISRVYHVSVGNTSPIASTDVISIHKLVKPFQSNISVTKLNEIFSDQEDSDLDYYVTGSDFDGKYAYVEDELLYVDLDECPMGNMVITAKDSRGASASVRVEVKTKSLAKILKTIGVPLLAIFLIILTAWLVKKRTAPICGRIQVVAFEENDIDRPRTIEGDRGKMTLSKYYHTDLDTGISLRNCSITAGKDGTCIFTSSKAFYEDDDPDKKQKKVILQDGISKSIKKSLSENKGIEITFFSDEQYY